MTKRARNQTKLDEAFGLADLGAIDGQELERRLDVAGVPTIDGGSVEDAPDEVLIAFFNAPSATYERKCHFASLIVARGLTACGCEHCQKVERYAKRGSAHSYTKPEKDNDRDG